uniref:Small ribosomal subunit protein eS1 n=1 Tax=Percolomonas cosmopolitus TaxID=63605 RepID=A0A6U0KUL7_9EUKA
MTAGKSKRIQKGSKKHKKKDAFKKKEWYKVHAPTPFKSGFVCHTPVNKTVGTKLATTNLKGRVFEVSCGDLMKDETMSHQVIKLRVEDIEGKDAYTAFYGARFTTDKLNSLVRKWHTLIEAQVDVKTTDGYTLRLQAVGFTRRRRLQVKKTCYAQSAQVTRIQGRMRDVLEKTVSKCDTKKLCSILMHNLVGREIEKQCAGIYPLQNVFVHKVTVVKAPKLASAQVRELHNIKTA